MYRAGHYGMALLVFAPVGFALWVAVSPALAVAAGAGVLFLAMLPDYDHRLPVISHRGVTHTLPFAVAVSAALGACGWVAADAVGLGSRPTLAAMGALVGGVAVGSHLLADLLTPAGVKLLWPLSGESYSLSVSRADNTVANYLLFALGVFVTVAAALTARTVA